MKRLTILASLVIALFCITNATAETKQTTVRVQGKPIGTFESDFTGLHLTNASVTVRNVGSAPAKGVRVYVTTRSGLRAQLHNGPSTLEPNQKATYSSSLYEAVPANTKLKGEVSCSNCR